MLSEQDWVAPLVTYLPVLTPSPNPQHWRNFCPNLKFRNPFGRYKIKGSVKALASYQLQLSLDSVFNIFQEDHWCSVTQWTYSRTASATPGLLKKVNCRAMLAKTANLLQIWLSCVHIYLDCKKNHSLEVLEILLLLLKFACTNLLEYAAVVIAIDGCDL